MSVEIATVITDLNEGLPAVDDPKSEGDDHFRLIKRVLRYCFPSISGAITLSHDEINGIPSRIDELNGAAVKKTISGIIPVVDFEGNLGVNAGYPIGGGSEVPNVQWVQDFLHLYVQNQLYPVGHIIVSGNPANPATYLGFGTWEAQGTGRVLVGVGTGVDSRGESVGFTLGQYGGEYRHQLTIPELASHTHPFTDNTILAGSGVDGGANFSPNVGVADVTGSTGNDQPHNNVQPYLAVHFWQRTA